MGGGKLLKRVKPEAAKMVDVTRVVGSASKGGQRWSISGGCDKDEPHGRGCVLEGSRHFPGSLLGYRSRAALVGQHGASKANDGLGRAHAKRTRIRQVRR